MTPAARSLKHLRAMGWTAEVVEHYNPFSKRRHDLFGIFDLLAVKGSVTMGIQVTSGMQHKLPRLEKIRGSPAAAAWLAAGNLIEVWVWRQLKPRGTKVRKWRVQRVPIRSATDGRAGHREAAEGERQGQRARPPDEGRVAAKSRRGAKR